jgi:hypothetical protein
MLRTGGGNADDLKRPVRAQRGLVAGFRPEHGGLERGRVGPAAAEASIGAVPVRDVPESRNPNTVALFRVLRVGIPGADDGGWYPTRVGVFSPSGVDAS